LFDITFQVITEDLEKRVEESKKEYDQAKEKAKEAIAHSVVQTEVITPKPSNGITSAIPRNISSTTPNKYVYSPDFLHVYIHKYTHLYIMLIILNSSYRKPIKKRSRSRSRTPLKIKSRSKSPRHLKKLKKRR